MNNLPRSTLQSLRLAIILGLGLIALTACSGTPIYRAAPDNTAKLSAAEAKQAISQLVQLGTGAVSNYVTKLRSIDIKDDRIDFHFDGKGMISCPFEYMAPGVDDYGVLASGQRFTVGLGRMCDVGFWFEYSEDAINLANALFVMKHQVKAAPAVQTAAPVVAQAALPAIKSDVDELPPGTVKSRPNAYAVVVGIEQYRQKLPAADFATADARTVTTYLTKVLGYPEENVVTLLNDRASYVDLAKYFEKWLPNNVETGATVFVYYSGHGAPNPNTGDAYLVPYDGDPAFIDETGYSLKRMYAALCKLPAKEVVVALDSCFSGAGGRSVIAQGTRSISLNLKEQAPLPRNLTVLAASSGEQTSSTYADKGHGLFTYFLLKGIKNEDVVAADGSLRLDDLFAYLSPQVERVARKHFNNEQTPQLIGAE